MPHPVTFKEMSSSGHRVLQIGENRKRYLDQKPYSQKELAHQAKFKIAQAQTSAALKDSTHKAAFADEFKAALKAGTTEATTLRGFAFTKFYDNAECVSTPPPTPSPSDFILSSSNGLGPWITTNDKRPLHRAKRCGGRLINVHIH